LAQQAQAGMLLASGAISIKELARRTGKKKGPRTSWLQKANATGLVGCIIGATASGVELAANGWMYVQHKNQGVDPKSARLWIGNKVHEIDVLLARREAELNRHSEEPQAVEIALCENRLLKYYRDLSLYEFADWYADDRSYQPSNSVFYLLNAASNTLSAVSYYYAIRAVTLPWANAPQNFLALVGDGISLPTAPLIALTETLMYKHAYKKLGKQLNETIYDAEPKAKVEIEKLSRFVRDADPSSLALAGDIKKRLAVYLSWNDKFDNYIDEKTKYLRHLHEVAAESVIAGPAIGALSIADDALTSSAYFKYRNRVKTSNATNRAGAICLVTGAGGALLYNGQSLARELLYERKLRKNRELPEQQLQIRLETLARVEKDLQH
jgi:hypothetical protein